MKGLPALAVSAIGFLVLWLMIGGDMIPAVCAYAGGFIGAMAIGRWGKS